MVFRSYVRIGAVVLAAVLCFAAESLKSTDVKVDGALDYGQTSDAVEYTGTPQFDAFIFNGSGRDRIEVTVKGGDRKGLIIIADGALTQLASGTTHLAFTLPDKGPDPEAYYIVFRDSENKPARFTVELKKVTVAKG
jgi:hypothetical protein